VRVVTLIAMDVSRSECEMGRIRFWRVCMDGPATDDELLAELEVGRRAMLDVVRANKKLLFLLDNGPNHDMNARQRRIQADWNKETRGLQVESMLGIAFVAGSAIHRVIITGVFWVQPPPVPYRVCGSFQAALQWMFELYERQAGALSHEERAKCGARLAQLKPGYPSSQRQLQQRA